MRNRNGVRPKFLKKLKRKHMDQRNPTKDELDTIRALEKLATRANVKLTKAQAELDLAKANILEAMNELQDKCNVPNNAQLDVISREKWVVLEPLPDGKQRQRMLVQDVAKVTELKKSN